MINKLKKLDRFQIYFILSFVSFFSFLLFIYFFNTGQNLYYGDAQSRLNISRKIFDNLTPGFAQLGNIWLPLPELIMLPLVLNKYMWQSGLAGSIMSTLAYIVGGLYLFKTAKIISKSFVASFGALLVYALNINLLYFQTTAMSEMLFICVLILVIYNFVTWIKTDNLLNLIYAGIAVSALTLIRYEGLAVLALSIPMVGFYTFIKKRSLNQAEGKIILFGTVAALGFLIWTVYLAAIFGDPLYWKHVYLSADIRATGGVKISGYAFNLNPIEAGWKYFTATVWMNGLIPVVLAIISLPILIYKSFKEKSFYLLPILLPFAVFAFMVLTLQRNTPIGQPELTIANILSGNTSKFAEFNIRYGLLMLPLVSLLSLYLFNIRVWGIRYLFIGLLAIQFYSYFNPTYSVMYQIPLSFAGTTFEHTIKEDPTLSWLQKNYNGGLIMISALKHDPQMLQLGLDYKTYIHEGTGKYWKTSIKMPQKYAAWILFDSNNKDDQVTRYLSTFNSWRQYYNLDFDNKGVQIYKIKTKPEVEVKL